MHAIHRTRLAGILLSTVAIGVVLERASAAPAKVTGETTKTSAPTLGPGDTNVTYGPRTFTTPTGSQTVNLERFTITLDAGAKYLLKVVNGDVNGAKRATSGSVQLNGTVVVASSDLSSGPQTIVRDITPRSVDTVVVTIAGSAGSNVVVSVLATARTTVTLFGPKTYVKPNGNSSSPTDKFLGMSGVGAPFTLLLANGDSTGGHRASSATVSLNGTTVVASSEIKQDVPLITKTVNVLASTNTIAPDFVKSSPNSQITLTVVGTDAQAPALTIASPAPNTTTSSSSVTVSGSVTDRTAVKLTIAGVVVPIASNSYSASVPLGKDGVYAIHVVAVDAAGNVADSMRTVTRNSQSIALSVAAPLDGFMTRFDTVVVRGTVFDTNPFTVNANGIGLPVAPGGTFSGPVPLANGTNFIVVTATDTAGHTASVSRTGTRDSNAPLLTWTGPADGITTGSGAITVNGTVQDATPVTLTINGNAVSVDANGGFSSSVVLAMGPNAITVRATDAAGNVTAQTRTVTRDNSPPLPPDPSTVATAVNPVVATTFGDATAFLYTGTNPIQTGVVAGVIDRIRASVLRGRVTTRQGAALGGVTVSVLQHPEFGQTLSRADGAFDIALNGGGPVTVGYSKSGYLPVQRQLLAPRQDYRAIDDVVLIPVDSQSTHVDFSAPIQVARGSAQSDTLGVRRMTALFAQGTHASMTLADGTTQPLSSLTVRATEYTVGATGPAAMPAPLPPMSAYTYAAELSVDEATAAGASTVTFDKPVPVYVENFLNFPVGTPVPVASYDRATARWIPSPDGRIIKILSTTGGAATISVSPTNAPADSATLIALGISAAERQALANMYTAGQTLWRAAVTHFSPLDLNFPSSPPDDATRPDARKQNDDDTKPCKKSGSVIECTTQVLGEALPVTGTPFGLVYRSNRVRGFSAAYSQRIRLTAATVPPSLLRVDLTASIAGRTVRRSFSAAPNQTYLFTWDGKDAYGRVVNGGQPLKYRISYVYPTNYLVPPSYIASFGLPCSGTPGVIGAGSCLLSSNSLNGAGRESILSTDYETTLGTLDLLAERSGGWALSVHHAYDPVSRIVYLGDGTRYSAEPSLKLLAGYVDPNAPPLLYGFGEIWDLLALADGSLLVADGARAQVIKISASGAVTTFAGNGSFGYSGDNGPATQASVVPHKLAAGPDGSVYILANSSGGRIRRVAPSGIITTVAGDGSDCNGASCVGDDGPATAAKINPTAVDAGADGSIYITEKTLIRRVGPDGVIRRFAGDTTACFYSQAQHCGDGQPAAQARFGSIAYLRVAGDGSIYLADNGVVWRIDVNGIVHRVAGLGGDERFNGYSGDGASALLATPFNIPSLAPGSDGSFVFSDPTNGRLLRVGAEGIISTIVGDGESCCSPSAHEGFPTQVKLATQSVSFGPDGTLFLSEATANCCGGTGYNIYTLSSSYTGYQNQSFKIPNEDGSEVYEFDANGRHLRTRDGLTGRTILQFGYDAAGLLASITDVDGNVTRLTRDGSGQLTSIVSPFGQRTTVTLDAAGYLSVVANPAGEAVHLQHDSNGLLRSLSDPKGNSPYQFSYDSVGRLTRDTDPAGGFTDLARSVSDTSVTVTTTSQMGRVSTFAVASLPTGATRRSIVGPDGLMTAMDEGPDGTSRSTSPDGTVTSVTMARDPRFGLQAPTLSRFSVALPSGLTLSARSARVTSLSNLQDPLSLLQQTDSLIVGTSVSRTVFDAGTRTLTHFTAEGRQFITTFDTARRVVSERQPGEASIKYTYGTRGLLIAATQAGRVARYDYDSAGRLKTLTDPLGRLDRFTYDSAGRVIKRTLPDLREIAYSYDANGNVSSITPPGRSPHSLTTDSRDLGASYSPPAGALATPSTRLEYNLDRQVTRILRPDSLAVDLRYDAAGRLDTIVTPTGRIHFSYSAQSGLPSALQGASGNAGATLAFAYDGMLPVRQTWTGAVHGDVRASYDSLFRTKTLTVNGENPISLNYDRDDFLTSVGSLAVARDAASGRVTSTSLSSVTTTSTFHDSVGTLTRFTAKFGSTVLFDANYSRDTLGRIAQAVESVQGTATTRSFVYDSAGRLDQVRQNGVLVADYDYDINGNRSRLTSSNGVLSAVVDAQDRLISYGNSTFSYGSNGELAHRMLGPDTTTYTYDVLGNLLAVRFSDGRLIEYLVDPQNRRIGKRLNGKLAKGFLYQGQLSPIAEVDSANLVISRFVYGEGESVPEYMIRAGTTYRIITDQLGSVRLVVNASTGDVAQRIDYDEFGRVVANTNPGFQPFGFAGGLYDDDTKLTHFGARDYDAETGRWTAKDPLGFVGGQENLYVYVGNDPINTTDPDGLRCRGLGREVLSFVPVLGSGLDAFDDFQDGNYGWAAADAGMAALDGFGVGELAKGGWKLGSHTWKATRAWLGREGLAEKFQHVHHAFIPQGGWGAAVPDWLKNQWWNLKPLTPPEGITMNEWHAMVEGRSSGPTGDALNWAERMWHGSPDWTKPTAASAAAKLAKGAARGGCGCR